MMDESRLWQLRRGYPEAPPQAIHLRAGSVTAKLVDGELRNIRIGPQEIVQRVYVAVRDEHWGTVPLTLSGINMVVKEHSFQIDFSACHQQRSIDFAWRGSITGTQDGQIVFTMDGIAAAAFETNRIGLCVLLPMNLAGVSVQIQREHGHSRQSVFPESIAPYQPFSHFTGLGFEVLGIAVDLRLSGDEFEMEDQRNWTDASFKIYSRPLSLPFPYRVEAGERVCQSLTISTDQVGKSEVDCIVDHRPAFVVSSANRWAFPETGFCLTQEQLHASMRIREMVKALKPSHLHLQLDLADNQWIENLQHATLFARDVDSRLTLEIVVATGTPSLRALAEEIRARRDLMASVAVFPPDQWVTDASLVEELRRELSHTGVSIPIMGGTRGYYAELNRSDLPDGIVDRIGFAVCPQVHAFDDQSLVENSVGAGETVLRAKRVGKGIALAIGPISLRQRVWPAEGNPDAIAALGIPSRSADPRQSSLLGAGWTVAAMGEMAFSHVQSLTWYDLCGPHGLMDANANIFPMYRVFEAISSFGPTQILHVTKTLLTQFGGVAMTNGVEIMILAANLSPELASHSLHLPQYPGIETYILDDQSYTEDGLINWRSIEHIRGDNNVIVEMAPYAILRLHGLISPGK